MTDVRLRLIEMLTFPRVLAVDSMDADSCPHRLRFDAGDVRCERCEHGAECEWLESGEPFVALVSKPHADLVRALRFAVDYIGSKNHRGSHRMATCLCESCLWLRDARQLLREIDGRAICSSNPN